MQGCYLSACAIFRDEAAYLAEWIAFHRLVGVEHFFLYDNGSADHPEAVLAPYLAEGEVTLVPGPFPSTSTPPGGPMPIASSAFAGARAG